MPRLIDADALQLEPDPWGGMNGVLFLGRSGGKTMAMVQAALKRMIENAPAVDAVEVVHGRWIPAGVTDDLAKCSVCGRMNHTLHYVYSIGFNYCPNCGAKMDGDGNA